MINIFFVHGFWVQKDSRGMFPQIEEYLKDIFSDIRFEYTELNNTHENRRDTIVLPFSHQHKLLQEKVYQAKKQDINIIIAHSQWCVISSLLKDISALSFGIFLAPPSESDFSALLKRMSERPWSFIDTEKESALRRSDGTYSYIPKEYFQEREKLNYNQLYTDFCEKVPTYLIQAQNDEIIDTSKIEDNVFKQSFLIWWNHNFDDTQQNREFLLETLWNIIKENYTWKF